MFTGKFASRAEAGFTGVNGEKYYNSQDYNHEEILIQKKAI